MNYQKIKIIQRIIKSDKKIWVGCQFENGTRWIPSFAQLCFILNEIGHCEEINYLSIPGAMGREMPHKLFDEILRNGYLTKEEMIIILQRYDKYSKMPIEKQLDEIKLIITNGCK